MNSISFIPLNQEKAHLSSTDSAEAVTVCTDALYVKHHAV